MQDILPLDDRYVLTMNALQFILIFSPIISKTAMQTYYSTLPLMPSASLLSKKYSAMSQPSLKSFPESSYSQIIKHPQIMLPSHVDNTSSTSSGDIIALSCKGEIAFFDTRARLGYEIGSRISIPLAQDGCRYLIAFSPDGKWIAFQGDFHCTLEI